MVAVTVHEVIPLPVTVSGATTVLAVIESVPPAPESRHVIVNDPANGEPQLISIKSGELEKVIVTVSLGALNAR